MNRIKAKLVCGVGINDADYPVIKSKILDGKQKIIWRCPFYDSWASMLQRCYSEKYHQRHPTHVGCSTAPEWHYFMTFKAWMETQDWESKELDKDILVRYNKVYGPNTCVFVDSKVNTFITDRGNDRGEWPIGVTYHPIKDKYQARCNDVLTGKRKSLGYYKSPEDATNAWLIYKIEQAKILASQQRD